MHTPIYTEDDYLAIVKQQHTRWLMLGLPCVLLLAVMFIALMARIEWLTTVCTIVIGVILIAGYDLAIKPLHCYELHLDNSLHGRTRECDLPFLRMSMDTDLVDGVAYHQIFCTDKDAKGRPYERMFYFDAQKDFPPTQPGDMLHIVHHGLAVADVYPV